LFRQAGGKRWLVPKIVELLGSWRPRRYFEPFLGGWSMYLGLLEAGIVEGATSWLSDLDPAPIELARAVQLAPEVVALHVDRLRTIERACGPGRLYEDAVRLWNAGKPLADGISRPAHYLYLRAGCWNGLSRVNLSGGFNVPHRKEPASLPTEAEILAAGQALDGARLWGGSFLDLSDGPDPRIGEGDLIYLDPPYVGGFTQYTRDGWGLPDAVMLLAWASAWHARGAVVLM
jgi:DNA adenine methylase